MGEGSGQVFLAASVPTDNNIFVVKRQPLCTDPDGWGPISSIRYDFTPCFLDIYVLFVAVWGIVMGAGALWYLFHKKSAQPVQKNWHFYTKLVRSGNFSLSELVEANIESGCDWRDSIHDCSSSCLADRTDAEILGARFQVLGHGADCDIVAHSLRGAVQ